jgi:hypothetical protein
MVGWGLRKGERHSKKAESYKRANGNHRSSATMKRIKRGDERNARLLGWSKPWAKAQQRLETHFAALKGSSTGEAKAVTAEAKTGSKAEPKRR